MAAPKPHLPGVEKVTGHPWVTALRSQQEPAWAIPHAGAMEEHLVFLCIGASNMVGAVGANCPAVFTRPLSGPAWLCDPTGRCMKRVQEPLHPHDGKGVSGVGFCRAFARRVQRNNAGSGIFLVPGGCSQGGLDGICIDAWSRDGVLYSIAVARALTCAQAVGGRVAGVLWHQGEADACLKEFAEAYEGKVRELVSNLRTDLDDPELVFLVGEIGDKFLAQDTVGVPEAWRHATEINDALRRLAKGEEYISCIHAASTCEADKLHFDAAGMEEMGNRMGDEWHRMWQKQTAGQKRAGPQGEPLTREEWRQKYKGLAGPLRSASKPLDRRSWAAAPRWIEGKVYPKDGETPPPAPKPAPAPEKKAAPTSAGGLTVGNKVTAFGLVGAKILNGLTGTVMRIREDGRFVVDFVGHLGKALKRENLKLATSGLGGQAPRGGPPPAATTGTTTTTSSGGVGRPSDLASAAKPAAAAPPAKPQAAAAASATGKGLEPLAKGAVVVAFDLVGAKELNGLKAIVDHTRPDGRVVVQFEVQGEKALKRENLRLPSAGPVPTAPSSAAAPASHPAIPSDALVFIQFLEQQKDLNGCIGKVTSPVQEDGTVMVKISGRSTKRVPRQNLRVVTEDEAKSLNRSWRPKKEKKEKKEEAEDKGDGKAEPEADSAATPAPLVTAAADGTGPKGILKPGGGERDRDRRRRRREEGDEEDRDRRRRRRNAAEDTAADEEQRQQRRDDL